MLRERTRREARAAARLDHPSAVTVYDVVEQDGSPYLVLELVEARTLAEVVRDDGPLSPQRTAEVGLALLGALTTAHAEGIVHRDVKPSNVLVRPDGRVVLTDFGIATTTGDPSITSTGMLLGSPAYIAPERARGEAPAPASDLWSLGATLFTAVEGRPPFDAGEPLLTVTAVVTGEHAPYANAGPLEPVLDGLLVKDPVERLDADGAARLLKGVAEAPAARSTAVLTTPVPQVDPAPASRTQALRLGDVRQDVAAARPGPAPLARPRPLPVVARRRRGPAVAGAVGVALLLAAGGAVALTALDDPGSDQAAPTTSGAPPGDAGSDATGAPADQATDQPTQDAPQSPAPDAGTTEDGSDGGSSGSGVPAGWSTDRGAAGWTVALPPGYRETGAGEYVGPSGRTLRIETGPGKSDAVADRKAQAMDFQERHPSYREIRIDPVDYRGYEAADWEFTYEGRHVLNRVFVVDGTGHSLFFQTRSGDFAAAEGDFEGIAKAFQPAGA